MRRILGKELIRMMKRDKKIILIFAGVGGNYFEEIKKKYPRRCFDLGIREQSIVSIAAGLALQGLKPYIYGITPFIIERAFEQIKLDIDAMKTNVKLFCYSDYPKDGITHKELDAKTLMNLFKNIKSFYPETKEEFMKALKYDKAMFVKMKNVEA